MLQECACGEPLLDDVRKCPRCGKANTGYRQSRWRIFWPDVDTLAGADEAIRLGYLAAFITAVMGTIVAVLGALGANLTGLVDAALYALFGLGMWRKWRIAALLGFLLFVANLLFSISRGGGIGVLAVFIFVGFLNGLRGTFAHAKLSKTSQPGGAG